MRIAVIDDEKYSRVALVRQIEGFLPHAEIFEAGSGVRRSGAAPPSPHPPRRPRRPCCTASP